MSRDVVKVSPSAIKWRLSIDMERDPLDHVRWSHGPRHPVAQTDKYRSIVQRYVDGRPWEETPLFQQIYRTRLAYESVRGADSMEALLDQYYTRVDAMFEDMKANGWRDVVDGREATPIAAYLSHDNELLMGNQGNHRLAMAQILGVDHVIVNIVGRHPGSTRADLEVVPERGPALPESARSIPAMTTEAERQCYYRLTRELAPHGAIVELGTWLGAATAYIAAGVRDAGVSTRVHSYDRFVWKPSSHNKKAGGPINVSQFDACRANLGALLPHVDLHRSELRQLKWSGGPVSLLICDAPKRIAEISTVLTTFGPSMPAGAVMAWQDFAYFPSYDIPAALMRMDAHVEFVEAVYPGTTAVFRVTNPWRARDVSPAALNLKAWTADEVEAAWDTWGQRLPEPMRPRFACGAAMFLCDIGAVERAQRRLSAIIAAHPREVLPKWEYLVTERAHLMQRYQPLIEVLQPCA